MKVGWLYDKLARCICGAEIEVATACFDGKVQTIPISNVMVDGNKIIIVPDTNNCSECMNIKCEARFI